jgi:hypothetical protein
MLDPTKLSDVIFVANEVPSSLIAMPEIPPAPDILDQ